MSLDPAAVARRIARLYPRSQRQALLTAMTGASSEPLPELAVYKSDPVGFCTDVLGVLLTPDQMQIARAFPGRVKVNAAHNVGKTFLAACLALWWFYTRPHSVVITTAPTERDVIDLLWTEIRILHARAMRPLPRYFAGPKSAEMFEHEEHWAKGYTARRGESFQGRHRSSMMFIFDECHDDKTEVLTEHGWKFFADLDGTERLLTMDEATRRAEYLLPVRIVKRPHDGDVYHYSCSGADFCVTPGHKMLWQRHQSGNRNGDYGPWQRTRMEDLMQRKSPAYMTREVLWDVPEVSMFTIPAVSTDRKTYPDRVLAMDAWLEFLGWFLSEGHLNKAQNKQIYTAAITQKDPLVFKEICDLCLRLGFPIKVYDKLSFTPQVHINDMQLARWLSQWGGGALSKRVPDFIRHLCPRQIRIFLDAYVRGDGSKYPLREVIYTSSPRMASDLQELIVKTGVDSTITQRTNMVGVFQGRTISSTVPGYVVSRPFRAKKLKFKTKHVKKLHYSGMVYCAELPKHNLLYTRRNGKSFWSGNCEGIDSIFWEVTGTSYKHGEDHGWFAIGNPVTTASQSYVEDRAIGPDKKPKWNLFTLSALNHPNIAAQLAGLPLPIPNAVSLEQIDQWVEDWADPIATVDKRADDFEWRPGSDRWFRPGPQMKARGMGVRPIEGVDTVWGMGAWMEAVRPKYTPEYVWLHRFGITIGQDSAAFGDDYSVIHVRSGPLSLHHESRNGWSPQRLADRIKELCVEWSGWYNAQTIRSLERPNLHPKDVEVVIELDVSGADVLDHCEDFGNWSGLKVSEASDKLDGLGTLKFYNVRSEMWFEGAKKALKGEMDLHMLPAAVLDRLQMQLLTPSYKALPAGTRQVESKDDIKKRLKRSPDDADGLLVCYSDSNTWIPTAIWKEGYQSGEDRMRQ